MSAYLTVQPGLDGQVSKVRWRFNIGASTVQPWLDGGPTWLLRPGQASVSAHALGLLRALILLSILPYFTQHIG